MGHLRIPGFLIHFSQAEINNNFLAPKLGEHTYNVLKEVVGYSDDKIEGLRQIRII